MSLDVIPKLTTLSPDQVQYIHERSLEILGRAGVRVDSPRARSLLAGSDGVRWAGDDRALLQPDLVEWAIQAAPASVDLFDRRGQLAFRLGEDRTRFGIGVTNLYYQDPLSDALEPFNRQHMALAVRLGNQLPHYDVISTIGVLQDYPPETADLYAVLEMVANTLKPLVVLVSNEQLFPRALDLLEHLHGDLAARPFVLPYFNPITPLIINAGTADKMLEAIERGLPVIYSNYSLAGMSTPISAAGTLALMNAELLAGLVLAQLARPGAPVILGSLPAYLRYAQHAGFLRSEHPADQPGLRRNDGALSPAACRHLGQRHRLGPGPARGRPAVDEPPDQPAGALGAGAVCGR